MDMTRLLQATLPQHTVVRCEYASGLPAIEGDPTQIRQVIMNLLTNAAEAMDSDGGMVMVRTNWGYPSSRPTSYRPISTRNCQPVPM